MLTTHEILLSRKSSSEREEYTVAAETRGGAGKKDNSDNPLVKFNQEHLENKMLRCLLQIKWSS